MASRLYKEPAVTGSILDEDRFLMFSSYQQELPLNEPMPEVELVQRILTEKNNTTRLKPSAA